MTDHPNEWISAYADGELSAEQRKTVEQHLADCTECARELALIRSMSGALRQLRNEQPRMNMWQTIERRITTPLGWILLVAGVSVWTVLAIIEYFRASRLTLEWLTITGTGIGIALVFAGVAVEQYREWRDTPYKDVER